MDFSLNETGARREYYDLRSCYSDSLEDAKTSEGIGNWIEGKFVHFIQFNLQHHKQQPPTLFDNLGYFPLSGQLVGVARIVYGLVKAVIFKIAHLFSAFTDTSRMNQERYCQQSLDGILHVGRGLIEIIPIIGGFVAYSYDMASQH